MKRALLVVDVQNEYFSGLLPITHPQGHLTNILRVMDAAATRDIPLVVVQHTFPQPDKPFFQRGTPQWELHPEVQGRPHDLLIEKNLPGSFTGTELESWLRQQGIDTVVISGYMTHMCCDTTARQAVHRGFNVEFLSDATGTLPLDNSAGQVSAEELQRAILCAQQCCSARSSARTRGAGALRNRASWLRLALHVPREAGGVYRTATTTRTWQTGAVLVGGTEAERRTRPNNRLQPTPYGVRTALPLSGAAEPQRSASMKGEGWHEADMRRQLWGAAPSGASCALILSLLAAPLAAVVAQPRQEVPRVGYLSPGSSADPARLRRFEAFRQGLRELGYVEGQSIALEPRWAEGQYERYPALAADLIRVPVDVIVVVGGAATRAVQHATRTIPIVMAVVNDPVGSGLVSNLAYPRGTSRGCRSWPLTWSGSILKCSRRWCPRSRGWPCSGIQLIRRAPSRCVRQRRQRGPWGCNCTRWRYAVLRRSRAPSWR